MNNYACTRTPLWTNQVDTVKSAAEFMTAGTIMHYELYTYKWTLSVSASS